jgi:hypothetical protein
MRKGLLSLVLAGLVFVGCSTSKNNDKDLFAKISKDKSFKMQDYDKYFLAANHEKGDDMILVGYDLNKDGKPDALAKAKIIGQDGDFYITFPYAESLTVNPDVNDNYKTFYFDKDGDGKFDLVLNREESEPEPDDNSVSM